MYYRILFLIFSRWSFLFVSAFNKRNCRGRAVRNQFQHPDCYVPDLDRNLLLSEASFLMAHDAATGYINKKKSAHWFYSKTQEGSIYDQLENGARVLDIRPKYFRSGVIGLHHGSIDIVDKTLDDVIMEAKKWCSDNPTELVIILHNEMAYQYDYDVWNYNDDAQAYSSVAALMRVYANHNVAYYTCADMNELTIGDVMDFARLGNNGRNNNFNRDDDGTVANAQANQFDDSNSQGYLIALDRHTYDARSCAKMNWIEYQLVTCYPPSSTCTSTPQANTKSHYYSEGNAAFLSLKRYLLQSANNEATDYDYMLGPPEDLEKYPFFEIQALWQQTETSITRGLAHFSNLLRDNSKSDLNYHVMQMVYEDQFNSISLLKVDNVAKNGLALFSVLRNRCGQFYNSYSDSYDNNEGNNGGNNQNRVYTGNCGQAIPPPRINSSGLAKFGDFLVFLGLCFLGYHAARKIYNTKSFKTFLSHIRKDAYDAQEYCGECGVDIDASKYVDFSQFEGQESQDLSKKRETGNINRDFSNSTERICNKTVTKEKLKAEAEAETTVADGASNVDKVINTVQEEGAEEKSEEIISSEGLPDSTA